MLNEADFSPGPIIAGDAELAVWVEFEEALYVLARDEWEFFSCHWALGHNRDCPGVWPRWLKEGRIRQALRRVSPETDAAVDKARVTP